MTHGNEPTNGRSLEHYRSYQHLLARVRLRSFRNVSASDIVLAQRNQRDFQSKYVTITGKEVHRTAWQDINRTIDEGGKMKIEEVTANYSLLSVNDRNLVVRHDPEVCPATTCARRLLPPP